MNAVSRTRESNLLKGKHIESYDFKVYRGYNNNIHPGSYSISPILTNYSYCHVVFYKL